MREARSGCCIGIAVDARRGGAIRAPTSTRSASTCIRRVDAARWSAAIIIIRSGFRVAAC